MLPAKVIEGLIAKWRTQGESEAFVEGPDDKWAQGYAACLRHRADQLQAALSSPLPETQNEHAETLEKLVDVYGYDYGAFHRWTQALKAGAAALRASSSPETAHPPLRQKVRDALAFCFGDSSHDKQTWRIVAEAFDEAWPETAHPPQESGETEERRS